MRFCGIFGILFDFSITSQRAASHKASILAGWHSRVDPDVGYRNNATAQAKKLVRASPSAGCVFLLNFTSTLSEQLISMSILCRATVRASLPSLICHHQLIPNEHRLGVHHHKNQRCGQVFCHFCFVLFSFLFFFFSFVLGRAPASVFTPPSHPRVEVATPSQTGDIRAASAPSHHHHHDSQPPSQ